MVLGMFLVSSISFSFRHHYSTAFASQLHCFSNSSYNNPHANTAANKPLPATGPSAVAAPELFVGAAEPLGEPPDELFP